jgi:hypothetical protein
MVDHVGGVNPLGGADGARRARRAYQPDGPAPQGADGVELSGELQRLKQIEGIRLEKVVAMRRALADGTLVTDEKLDAALDRAIDDAFGPNEAPSDEA